MNLSGNVQGSIPDMLEGSISGMVKALGGAPVLNSLSVSENGTYTPPTGIDGYNKVVVNVPAPVLDNLSVTENGTYTPPTGTDGYDEVVVNVSPDLDTLSVTENGTYTPPTGTDGYDEVVVNVSPDLDSLSVTENGTYTPPTGTDGYDEVVVNVPQGVVLNVICDKLKVATSEGYYLPPQPLDKPLVSGKQYITSLYNETLGIHVESRNVYNGAGDYYINMNASGGECKLSLTDTTATVTQYSGSWNNMYIKITEIPDEMFIDMNS